MTTLADLVEVYRGLADDLPGMVYRAGADWRPTLVHNSVALCGYTSGELCSGAVCWFDLIVAEDRVERPSHAGLQVREYRIRTKGGEVCWVEERTRSFSSREGVFAGVSGVVMNIDTRKATELALREARDHAGLLARRQIHAEERERERIGRELHDRVGTELSVLGISLAILEQELTADHGVAAAARIGGMTDHLERISATIGELVDTFDPTTVNELGLDEGLRAYAADLSQRCGIGIRVVGHAATSLSGEARLVLFRIAQEAVINSCKHGAPSEVTLTLDRLNGRSRMSISDDGCGFVPDGAASSCGNQHGLGYMRDRATTIGARLTVESAPGHGTRVTVELDHPGPARRGSVRRPFL
ncbi:hypothetical protein JCM17961_35160 [Endothiovibrio diazotrophicus]